MLTYPLYGRSGELIRRRYNRWHHRPPEPQSVHMECTSVAVHEHHGGGEVEQTGRKNAEARPRVEGVAGGEAGAVVIETAAWQH